jgi:hypothetical protein
MHRSIPPSSTVSTFDQVYYEAQFQIRQMPVDILKKLNNTPSELSNFIQTLPTIQSIENKRKQLIEHNRHLAMNNLKKEPELINTRKALSHSFAELSQLRDKYFKIKSQLSEDMPSVELILAQLQSSVHANEQSNDEMIETFLHTNHNDSDTDRFVKHFLYDRQETIKLRFIAEKFFDLYQIEKQKN